MSDDNVISLNGKKAEIEKAKPTPLMYEVHFYPSLDGEVDSDVQTAGGFLKFGPQLIAILDGPLDTDSVVFAAATPVVKFIKRVDSEGSVQGTLSL